MFFNQLQLFTPGSFCAFHRKIDALVFASYTEVFLVVDVHSYSLIKLSIATTHWPFAQTAKSVEKLNGKSQQQKPSICMCCV